MYLLVGAFHNPSEDPLSDILPATQALKALLYT